MLLGLSRILLLKTSLFLLVFAMASLILAALIELTKLKVPQPAPAFSLIDLDEHFDMLSALKALMNITHGE